MNSEKHRLINRTELAADRAEKSGFSETATALRAIALTLRKLDASTDNELDRFQQVH